MNKYQNLYRIKSIRLKNWDYSTCAHYFITICTKNRIKHFGSIVNSTVTLSAMGLNVKECWEGIPTHYPQVELDKYIIMPNHVHGIIIINNVETQNLASRQEQLNKFGPQSMNIGSIIRGFKIGVKKWAVINEINLQWQPRFYEHIIRNEEDLNRIRQYIDDNPSKWDLDPENV